MMRTREAVLMAVCLLLVVLFGCNQENASQDSGAVAPARQPLRLPVAEEVKKAPITHVPITPTKKSTDGKTQEAEEIMEEVQRATDSLDTALDGYGDFRKKMDAARKQGIAKREAGRKVAEDVARKTEFLKTIKVSPPRASRKTETKEQKELMKRLNEIDKAFPTKADKLDPNFDLEGAIAGLSSPDAKIRMASIKGIDGYNVRKNRVQTRAATKHLCALLESETDGDMLYEAVNLLGELQDENGITALTKVLQGNPEKYNAKTRAKASRGIGYLRNEQARDILIETLTTDSDSSVRADIALALSDFKEEKVVDSLIEALAEEKEPSTRACIVRSLGNRKSENKSSEAVIGALKSDEDDKVRKWAASSLSYDRNPRAELALIAALDDKYYEVRKNAVESLRYKMSTSAIKPLIEILKDENAAVKSAAANALGSMSKGNDVSEAVEPMIECLENFNQENSFYMRSVIFALSQTKDPRAVAPISRLLNEAKYKEYDIRQTAANCLGNIGDPSAKDVLSSSAKNDSSERVRKACEKALAKFR